MTHAHALWLLVLALLLSTTPAWSAGSSPAQPLLDAGIDATQAGDWPAAEEKLREATRTDPKLAKAHYNLGLALYKQGKKDAAVDAYGKAVSLQPEYPRAHCELGHVLADLGKIEMAIVHLKLAVEQDPSMEEARSLLNKLGAAKNAMLGRPSATTKERQGHTASAPGWLPVVPDRKPVAGSGVGVVVVTSQPVGATVLVNGEFRGFTPIELSERAGDHHIEVRADGYRSVRSSVEFIGGERRFWATSLRRRR